MKSSPQVEDGYTRIANELLDAIISSGLGKREFAIFMAIVRKTYGFNKKEDMVSGWQIAEMTGIDRAHVSKTINEMVRRNILIRSDRCRISHGQQVHSLSINKHYEGWVTVAETATPTVADLATVAKTAPLPKRQLTVAKTATVTVAETATPTVAKTAHTKDNYTKDNKDNSKRHIKTLLPVEFLISPRVQKWAAEKGYKNLDLHLDSFILKCKAKGYAYIDWDAAFMNAIRDDWAGLSKNQQFKTAGERRNENIDRACDEFVNGSKGSTIEGEFAHG